MSTGVAVLDACVLFRGRLTDILLHLAEAGLFDPAWSAAIHAEWMRGLQRRRAVPWTVIAERHRQMLRAFPAAGCEPDPAVLDMVLGLCRSDAERKDAHVTATALAAGASWIVTDNVADFPRRALGRFGLRALRPDAFCAMLFEADPAGVLAGVRAHRTGLYRSGQDPDAYRALLAGRTMSLRQTSRLLACCGGQG